MSCGLLFNGDVYITTISIIELYLISLLKWSPLIGNKIVEVVLQSNVNGLSHHLNVTLQSTGRNIKKNNGQL
jgi:hypothetical protein